MENKTPEVQVPLIEQIRNQLAELSKTSGFSAEQILLNNVKKNEADVLSSSRELRAVRLARALIGPELARIKRAIVQADKAQDHKKSSQLTRKRNSLRTSLHGFDMATLNIKFELHQHREMLSVLITLLREHYNNLG